MTRDELVKLIARLFMNDATTAELDSIPELIAAHFGPAAIDIIYQLPTSDDPEYLADRILNQPKSRTLITSPPETTEP